MPQNLVTSPSNSWKQEHEEVEDKEYKEILKESELAVYAWIHSSKKKKKAVVSLDHSWLMLLIFVTKNITDVS